MKQDYFESYGIIKFSPRPFSPRIKKQYENNMKAIIVEINDDICDYYAWLFKKRFNLELLKGPRGSHITFVNDYIYDNELYEKVKSKWDSKKIFFKYYPTTIKSEKGYWWFDVVCPELNEIRTGLGLGKYYYRYHITFGHNKPIFNEAFEYAKRLSVKYEN